MAQPAPMPPVPRTSAQPHQARHLLAVPADVLTDEIEVLALSRFSATRWDVVPADVDPNESGAPQGRPAGKGEPGVLRTSRHTTVTGPYLPQGDGFDLGLPPGTAMVFDVVSPRERGEPPYPGGGDRDGLGRSFPAGMPEREEGRVLSWLIAVARRLGGSLRLDVAGLWDASGSTARGAGVTLTPDPGVTIDMSVYSDVWLDPQAAFAILQPVHVRTVLATQGTDWQGPPRGIADRPLFPGEKMDPEERKAIHAAADDFDIAALQAPHVLDGYGLTIDLQHDGIVAVEIGGEEQLPLLLRGLPWTANGAVCYRVRWEPPDLDDWHSEFPSMEHRIARKRAAELVSQVALAIYRAVGGEIADEDGFLVDPDDL
ncbi:hypothetical protein [Antribacter gilvus]|uniref:hypothetical protein n=1 Tax=Antribacter gilvus TaxID=2304675 RepID=UPI000F7AE908|nr:hypothetical protein [Antribacter gilvus]